MKVSVSLPDEDVEFLDDYAVARVFGSVYLNDHMEIFARMENVLDEDFETTQGYDAPGFGAFGGLRITF